MKTIGTENPLKHELAVPPLHIPDDAGGCYKTELVLERSKARVVKIHWWHAPDPRRDPHNHPWEVFRSTILAGGYTETRYRQVVGAGGVITLAYETQTYGPGDVNKMPHNVFHTVDDVLPGTVTRMETGPVVDDGEWGYLDRTTGHYYKQEHDPHFYVKLLALNPHKRRKP